MTKTLSISFFLIVLLTGGCASRWVMETPPLESQLQWPLPPVKPRVRESRIIQGFKEENTTLRTFITGRGENLLVQPVAVTEGSDGRIAVADTGCKCVHLYIPGEQKYEKISTAKNKELLSPVAVAFDDELRLYVSDSLLRRIFVYDSKGNYLSSLDRIGGAALKRATGLAYDDVDKVMYVVDTYAHKIYGIGKQAGTSFSFGERGTSDGQFNYPTHIFWSPSMRQLYITDAMNFRIQIFDPSGKFISSFGHHGDGSGDFAMPKGVAVDKAGTVYVVDTLFDNVQLFTWEGSFLLTLGSRGTDAGEFWLPSGIFIDEDDTLYVCDTFNHRIQVFQIVGDGNE
jgi:DNA-binding beta-propeller fold protein YncE